MVWSIAEQGAPDFLMEVVVLGTSASTAVTFASCSHLLFWAYGVCSLSSLNSSGYRSQEALQGVSFCLGFLPQRLSRPLILRILCMTLLSIVNEEYKCFVHLNFTISSCFQAIIAQSASSYACRSFMMLQGSLCVCVCANACWQHTPSFRRMSVYLKFSGSIDPPPSLFPNRCQWWSLAFRLTPGVETFPNTWTGHKHRKNRRLHINTAIICAYVYMPEN